MEPKRIALLHCRYRKKVMMTFKVTVTVTKNGVLQVKQEIIESDSTDTDDVLPR